MSSALSMVPLLHQDTVVSPTRTCRQSNTAYKRQIVTAAAACRKPGELGALLRREGLCRRVSPYGVRPSGGARCAAPRSVGDPPPSQPIPRSNALPPSSVS